MEQTLNECGKDIASNMYLCILLSLDNIHVPQPWGLAGFVRAVTIRVHVHEQRLFHAFTIRTPISQ